MPGVQVIANHFVPTVPNTSSPTLYPFGGHHAPQQEHALCRHMATSSTRVTVANGLRNPLAAADVASSAASAKTPTRDSFSGPATQRAASRGFLLSTTRDSGPGSGLPSRHASLQSQHSETRQDVEMDDDDGGIDASDDDSLPSDSNRPQKKKKGQRFFCTDFPPCQLSFTRSEHLARHIRKHTGERPFQCHCSRRFSRLDNLRQHAQTVHVNEEIPAESLAATGTWFQRQIRTDRVRPPNRAVRTSTLSSQGVPSRTHSRNTSTSSMASTTSNLNHTDDGRRRPPPLAIATTDPYGSSGGHYTAYQNPSPGGCSTPTSAVFSPGTGSPRYLSELQSPMSSTSSAYPWGGNTPGRRLSVPLGGNPFQSPRGPNSYPAPYISPLASSTSSSFSNHGSVFASPTSSIFSAEARQNSIMAAEAEWRRRTWHPSTYTSIGTRPATSGLSYYLTPDAPRPAFSGQPAARQPEPFTRLPGIESFDHAHALPVAPARRAPSPMQLDEPNQPPSYSNGVHQPHSEVGRTQVPGPQDMPLHQNLTRLAIANNPSVREAGSHSPANAQQSRPQITRPFTAPQSLFQTYQRATADRTGKAHAVEATRPVEQPFTPRKSKRHGWYGGPLSTTQESQDSETTQRTSPEGSSSSEGIPTPSLVSVAEYHPAIARNDGPESRPSSFHAEEFQEMYGMERAQMVALPAQGHNKPGAVTTAGSHNPERKEDSMTGLEALVAVATRKD